jgi:hypothetical protein
MKTIIIITAVFCLLGIGAAPAYAAFYKYTDKDGILCFADNLQAVPEQYRATAVIVEGESKEEGTVISGASQPRAVEAPALVGPAPKPQRKRPISFRLMITAAIAFSAVLLFIFMSKQPGLKENKKILSGVRSALIAIVSLYLIIAHGKDVMTVFGFAGKAIDDVQQQSADKGRKAAQAMKKLDALFEDAQKTGQESGEALADSDKKQ